jgi:hypothetical protein
MLALISGCATQAAYEKKIRVYVGKPIESIMAQGKIPSRQYIMPSGNKIYCFNSQYFMTMPVTVTPTQSVSTVQGKNVYTTTYGGMVMGGETVAFWCNTCFVTDKNNIILSYHLEGNNCVARSS